MSDYWHGGWASDPMGKLPGTRAAAMSNGQYGPLNAIADIIGAIWKRNDERGEQKALSELYTPVDVNTSDTVSTPQFGDMSVSSLIDQNGQAPQQGFSLNPYTQSNNSMMDNAQRMGMDTTALQGFQNVAPAQFGSNAWYQQNVASAQPQAQQQEAQPTPQMAQQQTQPAQTTSEAVEYQKNLQEHPEWFDLEGNYIGNTYNMYDDVSDSNLDPLTARKLNLLSNDFQKHWGEPLGVTSMRRHGDGSSWHDSGQAFDVAGGPIETNPEARAWAVNQAEKYGLVPLDEYANPSPHATGGHLHFSDHGDELTNNYGGSSEEEQRQQEQVQPQQTQSGITMPQSQRYMPEKKELHQATPEQPWTEQYNSKERVIRAYDDAWSKKMKYITEKAPHLLQDRDMMANIMAMREKGKAQLLEDWDKTETKRNWDEFQIAMANGDYNKALFLGYKNGLDPKAMQVLMSPDYESQLVDFGGEQKIISKNRYTGDILVNGNAPTKEDLAMSLTPGQREQLALEREKFAHQVDMDNTKLAMAAERASGGGGGGGRSGGSSGGGSSGGSSSSGGGYSRQEVANANYAIKRHKEWMRANKGADETESPFYAAYVEGQRIVDEAHGIQQNDSGGGESGDDENVSAGQAIAEYQGMLNSGASYDDVVAQVQEDFDEEDADRIISELNPNDYANQFGGNNYRFAPINNIKGGFGAFNLLG